MGFGINNPDHGVVCNTGLGLGLISSHESKLEISSSCCDDDQIKKMKKKKICLNLKYDDGDDMFPSLTLGLAAPQEVSSASAVTNNNSMISVKKEKELLILEERSNSSDNDHEDQEEEEELVEGSPRKKLRLTKQQSALLEDNFKQHTTLNPKQKQALAQQLNLRPRQVEVWFQNRRARTKLKQTEVDCEVLKKCCETLTEENKRLLKELQDLKSSAPPQLYMHLPAPTLSLCPSCDRISGTSAGDGSSTSILTVVGRPPKPHFFSPYTHPSAAC